jgi:hypothetical protein
MATEQTTKTTTDKSAKTAAVKGAIGRRTKKKLGRDKRKAKIQTDKEFAKTYFEAKAKRAADKKVAFRKRNSKK